MTDAMTQAVRELELARRDVAYAKQAVGAGIAVAADVRAASLHALRCAARVLALAEGRAK